MQPCSPSGERISFMLEGKLSHMFKNIADTLEIAFRGSPVQLQNMSLLNCLQGEIKPDPIFFIKAQFRFARPLRLLETQSLCHCLTETEYLRKV